MKKKQKRLLAIIVGLVFVFVTFLATYLPPDSHNSAVYFGFTLLSLNISTIGVLIVFLETKNEE